MSMPCLPKKPSTIRRGRDDVLLEAQQSEARMFQDALRLIEKGIEIGAKGAAIP